MPQKSIVQSLENYKNRAREKYYEYGLHIRIRDLGTIENTSELVHEKLRHARIVHDLRNLNDGVTSVLRKSTNANSLLDMYNSVDLQQHNKTPANILEARLNNLDSIIKLVEKDPDNYRLDGKALSRTVYYSKTTGIIQQGMYPFGVKGDAKILIDYLWGKRKIHFLDKSPTMHGRAIKDRSVLFNCNLVESKLTNIIDNFNQQMKKDAHPIDARIRRRNGRIQLETCSEYLTSK